MRSWLQLAPIVLRGAELIEAGDAEGYLVLDTLDDEEREAWDETEALLVGRRLPLRAPRSLVTLRLHPAAIAVAASAVTDHPTNPIGPWALESLAEPFGFQSEAWRSAIRRARAAGLLVVDASVVRAGARLRGAADEKTTTIWTWRP